MRELFLSHSVIDFRWMTSTVWIIQHGFLFIIEHVWQPFSPHYFHSVCFSHFFPHNFPILTPVWCSLKLEFLWASFSFFLSCFLCIMHAMATSRPGPSSWVCFVLMSIAPKATFFWKFSKLKIGATLFMDNFRFYWRCRRSKSSVLTLHYLCLALSSLS